MGSHQKDWLHWQPFDSLPPEAIQTVLKASGEHKFLKGDVVFREGEPSEAVWLVESGWVRLKRRITQQRELTLDIVTPKNYLCGLSAFIGDTYRATAITATPVHAIRIEGSALRPLMDAYGRLAASVARLIYVRYCHITSAYSNAFAPVDQRIDLVLTQLSKDFGKVLPVTRKEVAELAGTTVETAIRVTRKMEQDRLLSTARGQITMLKPNRASKKVLPRNL